MNYSENHYYTSEEMRVLLAEIEEAYNTNALSGDTPYHKRLAYSLCEYTGYKYCVLTNNATSALYAAFSTLADEAYVYIQNITFVATYNAYVLSRNEKPILYDFDPVRNQHENIGYLDDEDVVVPVSIGGEQPSHPNHDFVIQDYSHRISKNMGLDNPAQLCITSFHPIKNINAGGEGGAIFTNDKQFYKWLKSFCSHSRDDNGLGMNFRMSAVAAIFAYHSFNTYEERLLYRILMAKTYRDLLDDVLIFQSSFGTTDHSHHLCIVESGSAASIREHLSRNGIMTNNHYPRLNSIKDGHENSVSPSSDRYNELGLTLPLHDNLQLSDIKKVARLVREAIH